MIEPLAPFIELTLLACRLLLATVFLLAGGAKLVDPAGSRKALRDFGLPLAIARPLVVLLPLLELAVAAALIAVSLEWYGACGALGLLSFFLIAVGIAMLRGRKPDCHCFGQLHSEPAGWKTLVRNALLAACAGWLVSRGPLQPGPDVWAWLTNLSTEESKFALVAGCVVALLFLRVIYGSRPVSKAVAQQLPSASLFSLFDDDDQAAAPPAAMPARRPVPVPAPVQAARPVPEQAPQPAPTNLGPLNLGLPIGTAAPGFELPALTGEMRSLQSLRAEGKNLLLIFSSPTCESCHALVSNLPHWLQQMTEPPTVVFLSRGTAEDNLAKLKDFEPSRVLLQREFEVAAAYDCDTTPTAVLVGADGLIRSDLALGGMAIRQLLASIAKRDASPIQIP
jgi:uncharacterized membrane protein YphA (DoxX/SURF4 family)/peroxiredoxin